MRILKDVNSMRKRAGLDESYFWKKGGCSKPPKTWRSHIAAASSFYLEYYLSEWLIAKFKGG
jgi:hypothetical protein